MMIESDCSEAWAHGVMITGQLRGVSFPFIYLLSIPV